MKKTLALAAAAALTTGIVLSGAQAASAADIGTYSSIGTYKVKNVINKTSSKGYNTGQRLAYCTVGVANTTCTISKTVSATRTIGVGLDLSRSFVAGKLNISSASTVGISVSCTSPKLAKGKSFSAYPRGTHYTYKVTSKTYRDTGKLISSQTSGALKAFNPDRGIHCL
ncbi:hypothetical protein GCM10017714_32650 [Curtobacterium pusillum]|uniref:Tat pathway signal sequence domain protein n=1 Tax=Curtobacterium pusillum TaxID=69373 RepID=A0ABX2MG97_9MICO|nr:hypothetical protein [Curtobacterium pusillum]NUU14752.1 hypothetical protein [Curtobacterium pusillum]GLK31701.1 hypothetical protein GCM10017610_19860 [Curtobacterium pusillum]